MRTRDHHQQGLAKVLAKAFKIMNHDMGSIPLLYIMMLHGKDLDALKVTAVITQHMQPWFIRFLEGDEIEVRIREIWK